MTNKCGQDYMFGRSAGYSGVVLQRKARRPPLHSLGVIMYSESITMKTAASIWWSCIWRTALASLLPLALIQVFTTLFAEEIGEDLFSHWIFSDIPMLIGIAFVSVWALKQAILANKLGPSE
jgi:hypothetical protein